MLPLLLLKTAQGHPVVSAPAPPTPDDHVMTPDHAIPASSLQLIELKNGETFNGHLVQCDSWMNIHLREVICTSKDADRFGRMPQAYIRGNTIKCMRVPDEVLDKAKESDLRRDEKRPVGGGRGRGGRGRGPSRDYGDGGGRGGGRGGRGEGGRGGRGGDRGRGDR